MAIVLGNRAKMSTSTTGTGTITLGSALSGYQTFAQAGITNGQTVRYTIEDGTNFEIGSGVFTSSGTTLTRNVTESSNSDNAINLSGSGEVFITASAADIFVNDGATSLTTTGTITAVLKLGGNFDTNSHNILIDDAHFIGDESGNEQIIFQTTGSAVNQFDITNAASGSGPKLSATGGDSNIDLDLEAKGTGHVTIRGNDNSGAIQFNCDNNSHGQILIAQPHSTPTTNTMLLPQGDSSTLVSKVSTDTLTNKTLTAPKIADGGFIADANGNELVVFQTTGSAVNQLEITNNASGSNPILAATGGDTNIGIALTPKGTGEIVIAAGNLNYGGTAITATGADINLIDGITNGTVIASKAIITDSDKDISGGRNITISGELDAATGDFSGAVDIAGDLTLSAGADGALTFGAASSVKVVDNNAAALVFEEADNAYMTFVTTNSSEAVKFDKALDINGAVQLDATFTVGANDQGYDVTLHGDTAARNVVWDSSADSLIFSDNAKAVFGTGSDLNIWHDGNHSNVRDSGTGDLRLQGVNVSIQNNTGGENMATFGVDGAVQLYYDNAVKLATTATGVAITGAVKPTTYQETYVASSAASTVTLDLATATSFSLTMDQATTFAFSNPPGSGTAFSFTLFLTQHSSAVAITWPNTVDWAGGSAPDAAGANELQAYAFFTRDGGTTYYGFLGGTAIA